MADTSTLNTKWSWTQPDITYHPDRKKWENRTAKRLAEDPSLTSTPLPEGFPKKLVSPLVWEGNDWKNEAQWVFTLSQDHLKEINEAVKHFRGAARPLANYTEYARSIRISQNLDFISDISPQRRSPSPLSDLS